MFIETPKDPKLKAATRSDYKHHQTLKVLVSIMPCGAFNFISEGWGGRASDVAVTRESGVWRFAPGFKLRAYIGFRFPSCELWRGSNTAFLALLFAFIFQRFKMILTQSVLHRTVY
jgi:hypothetical protein